MNPSSDEAPLSNTAPSEGEALPGIRQFDLRGRSAIVTGGSKGLGNAIAAGLASAGADVILTSRHGDEAAAAAAAIASDFGRRAIGVRSDVTSPSDCDALVEQTLDAFDRIDILVNNAGIVVRGPIDEIPYEAFRAAQATNVDGTWLLSRAVVPHMRRARSGRIINLSSALGLVGLENRTPYATSKGAVVQLTRALALELAPFEITVNALCPGSFLTPMNEPFADAEPTRKFIARNVALGRWGRLEEIQGAAIFLASDAASYVTGSVLTVDGGWTAR